MTDGVHICIPSLPSLSCIHLFQQKSFEFRNCRFRWSRRGRSHSRFHDGCSGSRSNLLLEDAMAPVRVKLTFMVENERYPHTATMKTQVKKIFLFRLPISTSLAFCFPLQSMCVLYVSYRTTLACPELGNFNRNHENTEPHHRPSVRNASENQDQVSGSSSSIFLRRQTGISSCRCEKAKKSHENSQF